MKFFKFFYSTYLGTQEFFAGATMSEGVMFPKGLSGFSVTDHQEMISLTLAFFCLFVLDFFFVLF